MSVPSTNQQYTKGPIMNKDFIKIGCDPELFAFDVFSGKPVSVHDLLPGDKCKPRAVPKGAIQVDGTAAEFNIEPAATRTVFMANIQHVSNILKLTLEAKAKNLILRATPTVFYDNEYFEDLPDYAKLLGCEPDYNAYTEQPNPKPDGNSTTMRTGSGHIHIQFLPDDQFVDDPYDPAHIGRCADLVRNLDCCMYDASQWWDTDKQRMDLYGKPGAFRPKKYGVEYRTLSNAWLQDNWTQMYVFDAAYNITRKWLDGFNIYEKLMANQSMSPKQFLDLQDANGIPSIRSYEKEGYIVQPHSR